MEEFSGMLERNNVGMGSSDSVDELKNERLTENVRSAGASKIGFVIMISRKRRTQP